MDNEYERQERCINEVKQRLLGESGMSEPVFFITTFVVIYLIINYFFV